MAQHSTLTRIGAWLMAAACGTAVLNVLAILLLCISVDVAPGLFALACRATLVLGALSSLSLCLGWGCAALVRHAPKSA